MNIYPALALFALITITIIYFSKDSYDKYMFTKYGQKYSEKAWIVYGGRTNFYRIAIAMGFIFTIIIVSIAKVI